jgi:transposase
MIVRKFWEEYLLEYWPQGRIHLVMDNLKTHKRALQELPAKLRRRLKIYWTPVNSSWLNLVESYFASLPKTALHNTDFKTPDEIEQSLLNRVVNRRVHLTHRESGGCGPPS